MTCPRRHCCAVARRLIVGFLVVLHAVVLASCAKVTPQPDYDRVAGMVRERTNSPDVFGGASNDAHEARIRELLAEGLTVDKTVQLALLNSPEFQALFDQIGASRADVVQSQLLTNPGMALTMIWPDGGGRQKIVFNMGQELVDLWQIPVKKKIAEAQLEQAVLSVVHKGIDLATDTRSAAYKLLALQKAEAVAKENVEFVEKSIRMTEERVKAEKATTVDINRVGALLLDAQLSLLTIQRDLRIARASLARTIGLIRQGANWTLVGDLPDTVLVPSEAEVLEYALTHRLDAQALAKQVEASDQQLRRQILSVFPRIVAGPSVEQKDTKGVPGRNILGDTIRTSIAKNKLTAPTIQSRDQRNLAKSQIIDSLTGFNLALTLPIWDQNQAQIAKARFVVEQRQRELEGLLNTIAQDVEQAAIAAETAMEVLRLYHGSILPQAESNFLAARKAYEEGKQSITAMIEAQKFRMNQRLAEMNAHRELAVSMAALERAVGGRLPNLGVNTPQTSQPTLPN